MEHRGRDAAQVTVTLVDTVQYCSPGSLISEPSSDLCVYMENKVEGRMNPKPTQLESSAGTDLEIPGQQYLPNGEAGRTAADGYLLVGVGSNLGGNPFSHAELDVGRRADSKTMTASTASNTVFL